MLLLSAIFGVSLGAGGSLLSAYTRLPAGPAIVLVGTGIFLVSMLFAPERGAVSRYYRERQFRQRMQDQETLLHVFLLISELNTEPSRAGDTPPDSVRRLQEIGYLEPQSTELPLQLTDAGLKRGQELWQSPRLWEIFMDEHAELVGHYSHFDRETLQNQLPPVMLKNLQTQLTQQESQALASLKEGPND
jgi:manganese/zinc/iron transport system permease protein